MDSESIEKELNYCIKDWEYSEGAGLIEIIFKLEGKVILDNAHIQSQEDTIKTLTEQKGIDVKRIKKLEDALLILTGVDDG